MANNHTTIVLQCLIAAAEYASGHDEQGEWLTVYLDNARPEGMSAATFRACLSALAKQGRYRPVDGFAWGEVLDFW